MVNAYDFELNVEKLEEDGLLRSTPTFDGLPNRDREFYPDMLASIFEGQRKLMDRYHEIEKRNGAVVVDPVDEGELDDRGVQMRLKDLAYRVVEELSEATNCLKNKPWKDTFVETDRDHFIEEASDAFHFFIEWCITAGMTPEDLFAIYYRKHAVNRFRQESKY